MRITILLNFFLIIYPVFLGGIECLDISYKDHSRVKRQERPPDEVDQMFDDHDYYTSRVVQDPDGMYWDELVNHTKTVLSDDHLKYWFTPLSFDFPFYGHPMNRIAITTQGFLYMSDFVHPDLDWAFSHYVAPLMGNFDTLGEHSSLLMKDYGDRVVIEWRDVVLNDQPEKGNFTFQTTLIQNGTIVFGYKKIPTTNISGEEWPVKVGISDAYYFDVPSVLTGRYIRYIIKYHNISKEVEILGDDMAIIIDPLPTCNTLKTCENCIAGVPNFNCTWCPSLSMCSDGTDRFAQQWLEAECSKNSYSDADQCLITTTTSTTTTTKTTVLSSTKKVTPSTSRSTTEVPSFAKQSQTQSKNNHSAIAVALPIVLVLLVIFVLVGAWIFYARTHPTTRSGIWLIENSPRRIKEKIAAMSFFKGSEDSKSVVKAKYETHDSETNA